MILSALGCSAWCNWRLLQLCPAGTAPPGLPTGEKSCSGFGPWSSCLILQSGFVHCSSCWHRGGAGSKVGLAQLGLTAWSLGPSSTTMELGKPFIRATSSSQPLNGEDVFLPGKAAKRIKSVNHCRRPESTRQGGHQEY